MDPVSDEWLNYKNEPIEEAQNVGNIAQSWQWRERGIDPMHCPPNKTVFENIAEDILVQKPLKIRSCDLPGYPRSTFLMVFSPDGTKVASTHGNHNVYVSELASGKHVRILKGHPRTPWCIAFHPSHPQLIGSGCLGGQVRVWDIASGGSEVWNVHNETVIASIAFHPREQILVIATYNELYFWDWSQSAPCTKVSTSNVNEKVRYVAFDALGYKLITGISLWPSANNSLIQQSATMAASGPQGPAAGAAAPSTGPDRHASPAAGRRASPDLSPHAQEDSPAAAQDMIVNSYQNLVQRYDSLVRNYQRLFMIDRGTDPMETDLSLGTSSWTRASSSSATNNEASPTPGTSRNQDTSDQGDIDGTGNRLLNLGVLSFDSDTSRDPESSNQDRSSFRSRSSAFHPLNDSGRSLRTDVIERTTRLLPNPFSASGMASRLNRGPPEGGRGAGAEGGRGAWANSVRDTVAESEREASALADTSISATPEGDLGSRAQSDQNANAERERGHRPGNVGNAEAAVGRGVSAESGRRPTIDIERGAWVESARRATAEFERGALHESVRRAASEGRRAAHTARTSVFAALARDPPRRLRHQPPTTANSSTQMSPSTPSVDAHAINESLDLIRDILRDSGTRLLNLITNISLATLASVERTGQRRPRDDPAHRPSRHYNSPIWHRSFLSSSSDSENDHSLEVNILRTRNSTFQEDDTEMMPSSDPGQTPTSAPAPAPVTHATPAPVPLAVPVPVPHAVPAPMPQTAPVPVPAPTPAPLSSPAPNRAPGEQEQQQQHLTDRMFLQMIDEPPPSSVEEISFMRGVNISLASNRYRVRSQGSQAMGESAEARGRDARPSTSRGSGGSDLNSSPSSRPSSSRENFWSRGSSVPSDEAYRKVRSGVSALQKHTMHLTNLWLRGNRTTMRELRSMWENLRRRILMLHRETGRQDLPSYYTRSLLERCMILTEMSDGGARPSTRTPRSNPRTEDNDRSNDANRHDLIDRNNTNNTNSTESTTSNTHSVIDAATPNTSQTTTTEESTQPSRTSQNRSSPSTHSSPSVRRRLQSSFRWRPEDELRRRSRNATANRLSLRYSNRSRRDFARAIEISATRHEIRMRAMQVLSVMFNMMMMCLEERGLSQLIINMLRTLKKALALTCLMLMTNRNNGRGGNPTPPGTSQRVDSLNVVRIQNVDHTGPVNVDGPEDSMPPLTNPLPSVESNTTNQQNNTNENTPKNNAETVMPSTSRATLIDSNAQENNASFPISNASQRWSNRLAVQIAAANRNNSPTARNRRELYLECKRLKALHRTNPSAHPFLKKRTVPPVSTHRIPSLRYLPGRTFGTFTPRVGLQNTEPVAGPSHVPPSNTNQDPSRNEMMNEFENRVNFIRIAHMQAVRLRNAARSRFRRLQTIRLYTPSSVREMFTLQNNTENQPESRAPSHNNVTPEIGNRRSFTMYRTHILTPRGDSGSRPEQPGQFHSALNNLAMPLMQVNDLPAASDAQGNPTHRLPRIHEYLQPIILAQNAMVVEEDGGGGGGGPAEAGARRMAGMAGLLDAGILSEALPAPSHRVQAWDFTVGEIPDIADCTKNVVVQRCRIHNDASIDISKDGRLLVALLPVPRLRNTNHWLGVYSLEWARLGQCLHTAVLEQSAVSVALSPTARHLAVGLGSRRFTTAPHSRNNVFALLYRLDPLESSSRTGLSPIKELEQNWEHGFTSLNCLRWAPQPGQGLVYANNTGQLIIMS